MADIKIKATPDEIQQVVGSLTPPAGAAGPVAPPAPPMPAPAQAGYRAFAADPLNQSAITKHISAPDTPILPPSPPPPALLAANPPWMPGGSPAQPVAGAGGMASVNPPKSMMASANPPALSTVDTSSAATIPYLQGTAAGPATVNPYGSPTQAEYFTQHPGDQARKQFSGGGWVQNLLNGVTAASLGAAGGLRGDPGAGVQYVQQGMERDAQVPDINAARYRNAVVQPQVDAQNMALTQAKMEDIGNKADQQLAVHGLKRAVDDNGNSSIVADEESPVYKAQQSRQAKMDAQTGLIDAQAASTQAQQELREAQTAYNNARSDPNSPLFKQTADRLAATQANAAYKQSRLALSQQTYAARYLGTDGKGNALPGAMLTDDGTPVGSTFSQNVRPTGTERNKGDMANSAATQLSDIKDIVTRNRDLFGPGYGQSAAFKKWIGAQSPDAQRFLTARTIAGDHLAGTFGGRSDAALTALDDAIGQFKDNPDAALAGIDQLRGANSLFQGAGTVRTAGSKNSNSGTTGRRTGQGNPMAAPKQSGDDMITVQIPGQPAGQIHASQRAAFLAKFPNAKVQ